MRKLIKSFLRRPVTVEKVGSATTIEEKTLLGARLRNRLTSGRSRLSDDEAEDLVTAEMDHSFAYPGTVRIGIPRDIFGRPVVAVCQPVGKTDLNTKLRVIIAGMRRERRGGKGGHFSMADRMEALECAIQMPEDKFVRIWDEK